MRADATAQGEMANWQPAATRVPPGSLVSLEQCIKNMEWNRSSQYAKLIYFTWKSIFLPLWKNWKIWLHRARTVIYGSKGSYCLHRNKRVAMRTKVPCAIRKWPMSHSFSCLGPCGYLNFLSLQCSKTREEAWETASRKFIKGTAGNGQRGGRKSRSRWSSRIQKRRKFQKGRCNSFRCYRELKEGKDWW